ncbi:uncharacterized protein DS421_7g211680 [Arachis hypogaea]|nr:uncharacterized protein DS421_7g211680 [Arachis hypogaea]
MPFVQRSIKEYHKELLYLMCKANVNKGLKVLMGKFLIGLSKEIADKVRLYYYATMEDLVHLAIEVEAQQQFMATWHSSILHRVLNKQSLRIRQNSLLQISK